MFIVYVYSLSCHMSVIFCAVHVHIVCYFVCLPYDGLSCYLFVRLYIRCLCCSSPMHFCCHDTTRHLTKLCRDNQRWETGIISSGSIFENKMAIDNKMAVLGSFILAKYPPPGFELPTPGLRDQCFYN